MPPKVIDALINLIHGTESWTGEPASTDTPQPQTPYERPPTNPKTFIPNQGHTGPTGPQNPDGSGRSAQ